MPPFLQTLVLVLLLTGCSLGLEAPFHYEDILPVLPHQISWPALNSLHNAVDLLPEFVGAVSSTSNISSWKGACFSENQAWLELTKPAGNGTGGGILYIQTSKAHSWTCMDLYVYATPFRVTWDYYFLARTHTLTINQWQEGELEYVKQKGVSIFLMKAGMLGTLVALWDVLPIFSNTGWGQSSNIAFLERHMGATFTKRTPPYVANISVNDIHSGDFLVLSKIRGRWGGFETLEKWVTGAYAGHTAVCLRDEKGKLWVGESGHENDKGEELIALLPWEDWWSLQLKDGANPQIALLPLHPEMRSKFNQTTALAYARQMTGKSYGYHNMIFSWIDTSTGNYPPPLDANLVASVITVWTRLQPAYASNMWNEALNKRLGTQGLDLPSIMWEANERGIPFGQLLAIPEQDDWVYSDGKSTSCVAFVLEMYKEAGLFGTLSNVIQVTEFTIRDAYMLKFFEDEMSRLPAWCNSNDDPPLPYCQILGDYRLDLPEFNSIEPYPRMDERCPSLPPNYYRPAHC
ncbi:hypothetical protein O6H91_17G037100 [Diphasiastrum complanatum]|uniref:Uncharacterized protein n=6 Tax=Diphasiastrum complanatum TaxID=34168 RepID=A0ACC2B5R4_DIPCM|nr:hypothetical protein O6H91_17G013200 [Diphasiastrum complanatum]KAJ7524597.1 hypothetical protein O6H91_17G013200 [Diphasiastrum complanatum]KAJ7525120.1 hypothetical protein O6H91_17G037100 [Diphasiastrum complanatum]KAJ7525121.1 hypothetical protein O6H91_17G037100 [Diphasiastrum complanatum]KAJ7525122.1 hypothetical protein O6H91_17G037100 [Diphasiastrum complanatum]